MSTVVAAFITSACLGLSGNGEQACQKAMEAGSKQSGIEQNVNKFEKTVERKATYKATDLLGKAAIDVVGGGLFLAKTVVDKSVQFNVPTLGTCDKITNKVGVDKYSVQMEWGF